MAEATIHSNGSKKSAPNLLDIFYNTLLLDQVAAYLTLCGIVNLAATSRVLRKSIINAPYVYRNLNLKTIRSLQFDLGVIDHGSETLRNSQLDDSVTEDE